MFLPAFFFFSSRRRHTRFDCDWSSDVCSSDLPVVHVPNRAHVHMRLRAFKFRFCHGTLKKNKCVSQNRHVSARRLRATFLCYVSARRLFSFYPFTFDTISSALVFGTS